MRSGGTDRGVGFELRCAGRLLYLATRLRWGGVRRRPGESDLIGGVRGLAFALKSEDGLC